MMWYYHPITRHVNKIAYISINLIDAASYDRKEVPRVYTLGVSNNYSQKMIEEIKFHALTESLIGIL